MGDRHRYRDVRTLGFDVINKGVIPSKPWLGLIRSSDPVVGCISHYDATVTWRSCYDDIASSEVLGSHKVILRPPAPAAIVFEGHLDGGGLSGYE